jgi:hypothetical protein
MTPFESELGNGGFVQIASASSDQPLILPVCGIGQRQR